MNFDQRKAAAKELVAKFLDDYALPRGLPPDSLLNRIEQISDAFARRMPTTGDYAEAVDAVLMKIRDTHLSNSWPSQAVFVMAMPGGEKKQFAQLQQFESNKGEVLAKKMQDGEPVPETAIWGHLSSSLGVDRQIVEAYRKGSAAHWQATYRHDAHSLMRAKYGSVVDQYFEMRAAE